MLKRLREMTLEEREYFLAWVTEQEEEDGESVKEMQGKPS